MDAATPMQGSTKTPTRRARRRKAESSDATNSDTPISAATATATTAKEKVSAKTTGPISTSMKKKRPKKTNVKYKDYCDNCLTDKTPQWRKGRRGETFCQECGRNERRHDYGKLTKSRVDVLRNVLAYLLDRSTCALPSSLLGDLAQSTTATPQLIYRVAERPQEDSMESAQLADDSDHDDTSLLLHSDPVEKEEGEEEDMDETDAPLPDIPLHDKSYKAEARKGLDQEQQQHSSTHKLFPPSAPLINSTAFQQKSC